MTIAETDTPMPGPLVPPTAWRDDGDGGHEAEVMGYHIWVRRVALNDGHDPHAVWCPAIWIHHEALPIVSTSIAMMRWWDALGRVVGPATAEAGQALAAELLRGWLAARDEATRAAYEALSPEAQEALRRERAHWAMPLAGRLACGGPLTWASWTRDRTAALAYEATYACPACRVAALLDRAEELEANAARARAQVHDAIHLGARAEGQEARRHAGAIERMMRADARSWTRRLWRATTYGRDDER